MRTKPVQLSVMAVAALAVFAVAAVMLLASGGSAQADTAATIAPDTGGGGHLSPLPQAKETPTPTPRFPAAERCSARAAEVVNSGRIALFDVWWNPGEKELTNTSCPPTVTHVPANEDEETPAGENRSPSNINIEGTVIHVPNSAKVDLSTHADYTQTNYPALWAADDKENRSGSVTGDRQVWVLPACPAGDPANNGLCIGVSADLLNPEDWGNSTEPGAISGNRKVQFEFDHVHQLDIGEQGRRYALTYAVPAASATGPYTPIWDTSNADRNEMQVSPDDYEFPIWFFTRAGRYEFQVHVKGHPDLDRTDGLPPQSPDVSVTSDVRNYTFHVGLMADLSVGVTAENANSEDSTIDLGDRVTIKITASNAGPDTATSTKVNVTLPEGLTPSTTQLPSASTGTYDSATGIWTIGDLAVTNADNSPTLTITAQVDAQTGGKQLEVAGEIYATEHINAVDVVELDPDTTNNNAAATINVAEVPNGDPMFVLRRSVTENVAPGTLVGDPIEVFDPNILDQMTFRLEGNGADKFTVSANADGHAQIAVADGAFINYEDAKHYHLVLTVSDGKSHMGADDSDDASILLSIHVVDVPNEAFTATITADPASQTVGGNVNITARIATSPVPLNQIQYNWSEEAEDSFHLANSYVLNWEVTHDQTGQQTYTVKFWYRPADDGPILMRSFNTTVEWTSSN